MNRATVQRLRLVGLPVAEYRGMQQHHEGMLREFALITLHADNPAAVDVPRRLLELSESLRAHLSGPRGRLVQAADEAHAHGQDEITVELEVPSEVVQWAIDWLALVEEADAYCRGGDLLTLETPPELARFRRWLVDEVVGQLREGRPPRSYGG